MPLSGIHNFSNLQTGFPIRIASGMTNCERIIYCVSAAYKKQYTKHGALIVIKKRQIATFFSPASVFATAAGLLQCVEADRQGLDDRNQAG
jgi:hypothetical protein